MARPTLRQLEYAVAVAEEGNFGRAATACSVSQPALSAQIAELETRLGVTLFERGRNGATVTADGAPVIDAARRALNAADDVVEVAGDRRGELVGSVRVGVIPTMAPYLLPALVRELIRRHPRAEPVLREERTGELVAQLRNGDLDLGLLAAPVPELDDRLTVAELARDEFLLALPEGHPYAGDAPLPSSALAGLPLLLLEDGHCLRDQALAACSVIGAGAPGSIQATGLSSLCQMVAAGMGATLLPASAVEVETRPGSGLVVRPLRAPVPFRTVVLAWRPESPWADRFAPLAEALRAPVAEACAVD